MANRADYVELGLDCADVCGALDRGIRGRRLDDLNPPVLEAITRLTTWVEPMMVTLDNLLTTFLIAGLWRRSKGRSSNRASGMRSLELSMRRAIRKRSGPGKRTSARSYKSSTCVPSPLYVAATDQPASDRACDKHKRSRFRYPYHRFQRWPGRRKHPSDGYRHSPHSGKSGRD